MRVPRGREWKPVIAGTGTAISFVCYLLFRNYTPIVLGTVVVVAMIASTRRYSSEWAFLETLGRVVAVSVGWMMALVTLFWYDLMMIVAWCCIIAAGLVLWVESRTRSRYASSHRRLSYGRRGA